MEDILEHLDKNDIGICFDLKAFDTVDHNILLYKLYNNCGVRGLLYMNGSNVTFIIDSAVLHCNIVCLYKTIILIANSSYIAY